jgi:hypothetical protein
MDGDGVTYSFKDLFEKLEKSLTAGFDKLDKRVDQLNLRLDAKADNSTVSALEAKVVANDLRTEERFTKFGETLDNRFKPLELAEAGSIAVAGYKKIALGVIVSLTAGGIGELIYLLASGVH